MTSGLRPSHASRSRVALRRCSSCACGALVPLVWVSPDSTMVVPTPVFLFALYLYVFIRWMGPLWDRLYNLMYRSVPSKRDRAHALGESGTGGIGSSIGDIAVSSTSGQDAQTAERERRQTSGRGQTLQGQVNGSCDDATRASRSERRGRGSASWLQRRAASCRSRTQASPSPHLCTDSTTNT